MLLMQNSDRQLRAATVVGKRWTEG